MHPESDDGPAGYEPAARLLSYGPTSQAIPSACRCLVPTSLSAYGRPAVANNRAQYTTRVKASRPDLAARGPAVPAATASCPSKPRVLQ